jgi:DNA-binding transcriptional MerR regulator
MALNPNKNVKLYYSIKEVAQQFGINESTLRYWETEFPQLHPQTVSSTKVRQYTEKDIDKIKIIYNLVKVRGFKLAAARKMLSANRQGVDKSADVLEMLISVRDQLKGLKAQLDGLV